MSQQTHFPQGGAVPAIAQSAPSTRRHRSSSSRGRRRKKEAVFFVRRGDARRGRILMIAMFVVERLFDAAMSIGLPGGPEKNQVVAEIIVMALWCSSLAVGVLRRQNWCRYGLIGFEFLGATAALVYLITILPAGLLEATNSRSAIFYGAFVLIHGGFAWMLIQSRDIQRLTSRAQD